MEKQQHSHAHSHSHSHSKECASEHVHDHSRISFSTRWLLSVLMVGVILILLRPFLIGQMFVRVTSYSAYSYYNDAIRICKKIIAIDRDNQQAWTSLGYSYIDQARVDRAIAAFQEVLLLNPQNKGAASFALGQAYFLKKDFAKAIVYFQRVRSAGPRAGALLDADILKYRHGIMGFQSVHSMRSLLAMLLKCYKETGDAVKAVQTQKEYDIYKNKHENILF